MKDKRFTARKRAFSLAEIMICMTIIGLISILGIQIARSHVDYGEKMGYWATVKNLQRGTNLLMSDGTTDSDGHNVSRLPSVANSGAKGFCNRLADAYNTISATDCTATANEGSNFRDIKPNFTLSNGAVFYNLGSNPISTTDPIRNASFLGFSFPQKTVKVNKKPIYVSALMERQLERSIDDGGGGVSDSGGGGIISSVTNAVDSSINAVTGAAVDAGVASSAAVRSLTASASSQPTCPNGSLLMVGGKANTYSCLYTSYYSYDSYSCSGNGKRIPTADELSGLYPSKTGQLDIKTAYFTSTTCGLDPRMATQYIYFPRQYDNQAVFATAGTPGCANYSTLPSYLSARYTCLQTFDLPANPPSCPHNMVWKGTSCGCTIPMYQVDTSYCLYCASVTNSHVEGSTCACNSGYKFSGDGRCVIDCGSHGYLNTNGTCSCDGNYDMYRGHCTPSCWINQTRDSNGACVCKSGYDYVKGSCVPPCSSSQERVNGSCVDKCGASESRDGSGVCQCVGGYERVNGSCVPACSSSQERVNGSCVDKCGSYESRNSSGSCQCVNGYERYNGSCVPACNTTQERVGGVCVDKCGAYQSRDGSGVCQCIGGFEMYSGSCVPACNSVQERVNGSCVSKCDANESRKNGICVCNNGYDMFRGSCFPSCTNGKIRFYDGSCQCNYGTEWVPAANQCKTTCSDGQMRNGAGDCVTQASYYDIFVDVNGIDKGHSILNQDVFEFWVSLDGKLYPAPNSAMADNINLISAQITYLNPQEKRITLGQKYTYRQAICMANSVNSSFSALGYCRKYAPDSHCSRGNSNTCAVKLNLPGY